MDPRIISMYSLLVVGTFVVVAMVYWMFKSKDGPKFFSVMLVFLGFGMMGVGGFGPAYLDDYVGLVTALRGIEDTSDNMEAQTVAAEEIIQKYAAGEFTDQDWWIISAMLKESAVPELDRLLEEGEQKANPTRKQEIENTREDVLRYEAGIEFAMDAALATEQPGEENPEKILRSFDTRTLRVLNRRPDLISNPEFFHRIPPNELERVLNERTKRVDFERRSP